jgi:hypothetical protein
MRLSARRTFERFVELIRPRGVLRSRNARLNVKSRLRAADDEESRRRRHPSSGLLRGHARQFLGLVLLPGGGAVIGPGQDSGKQRENRAYG